VPPAGAGLARAHVQVRFSHRNGEEDGLSPNRIICEKSHRPQSQNQVMEEEPPKSTVQQPSTPVALLDLLRPMGHMSVPCAIYFLFLEVFN
jgi:hypothetical protein